MPSPGGSRRCVQEFQDQVWDWLQAMSADRPDLQARAGQLADPHTDPWGYLANLGELLVLER